MQEARPVEDRLIKVQVPDGLNPGDSFVINAPDGFPITVTVPYGSRPGEFIEIVIPERNYTSENASESVTFNKSTVGAIMLGGTVGMLFGPIGAVCLAGGAYYASKSKGEIGNTSRKIGTKTYNAASRASNWMHDKFTQFNSRRENN